MYSGDRRKLTILDDISGMIRPGRHVFSFLHLYTQCNLFMYLTLCLSVID